MDLFAFSLNQICGIASFETGRNKLTKGTRHCESKSREKGYINSWPLFIEEGSKRSVVYSPNPHCAHVLSKFLHKEVSEISPFFQNSQGGGIGICMRICDVIRFGCRPRGARMDALSVFFSFHNVFSIESSPDHPPTQ